MIYKMSMKDKTSVKLFSDVGAEELSISRILHFEDHIFIFAGKEELFISRILHFEDYILPGIFINKKREIIKQAIYRVVFEGLIPAFISLRELGKKWTDEKVPEIEKRQLIKSIYSNLVIAFKDRFKKVAKLMGYDIGFLFRKKEKDFENNCVKFLEDNPRIDSGFIEFAKNERDSWLRLMTNVRNIAIEHAAENDPDEIKYLESYMNLESVEIFFDNCWRAIEDFLFVFSKDKMDPIDGIELRELPEYIKDENHPERFGWFTDSNKLSNL